MNDTAVKKRGWVKNAAIIFLAVLLALTFLSNTIMNISLPEVAAQYTNSGSITSKVRGEGTITSGESYNVTIDESREIKSVKIKQGDTVEVGQVLFVLAETDSDEVKTAKTELEALEAELKSLNEELAAMNLQYQKDLITAAADVGSANSVELLIAQQDLESAMKKQEQALACEAATAEAQAKVDEVQLRIDDINAQNSALAADERLALELAKAAQTDAQLNLTNKKNALTYREELLGSTHDEAQAKVDELEASLKTLNSELTTLKNELYRLQQTEMSNGAYYDVDEAEGAYAQAQAAYEEAKAAYEAGYSLEKAEALAEATQTRDDAYERMILAQMSQYTSEDDTQLTYDIQDKKKAITAKEEAIAEAEQKLKEANVTLKDGMLAIAIRELDAAKTSAKAADDAVYAAEVAYNTKISGNSAALTQANLELEVAKTALERAKSGFPEDVLTPEAAATAVLTAQNALEKLELSQQQTALTENSESAIAQLDLSEAKRKISVKEQDIGDKEADITEKQAEVDKLKGEAAEHEITSTYSGTVQSVNVLAGDKTDPTGATALATIEVAERGYSVEFSVTNAQAAKVKVGDQAEITNVWGADITAILSAVKNDKDNPGQKKILSFDVTGADVNIGSNLSLSIGSRSSNYDCILPSSVVREDSNGKFVLVVTSKSSPLGNRYYASRVDIEVLASDDTNSAISGLYNGDFVITTSSAPIAAGDQVRLVNS